MRFKDLELTIHIPTCLEANIFEHVTQYRVSHGWKLIKIDAGSFRPFDFHILAEKSTAEVIYLSDVPLTLNALKASISAYTKKSHVGMSNAEILLEGRELRTFKQVLDYLISASPVTRGRVKTTFI